MTISDPSDRASTDQAEYATALIGARLERMPLTDWHRRCLVVIGTAHLFDAFDALTIAFVLPVLIIHWQLSPAEAGLAIAAGNLGQVIGAFGFGAAAERFGRARVLRWAIGILGLISLALAFAWSFGAFVFLRFVQGIGLGGETPVAATYVNEIAPLKGRGRIVFALQTVFAGGVVVASAFALWIIPHWGWRSMFVVGALPILLAVLLPRLVPESPRWLASRGRTGEAERIVDRIEASARGGALAPAVPGPPARRGRTDPIGLFKDGLARRTLTLWAMALCTSITAFGLSAWLPSLYTTVYDVPLPQALRYSIASGIATFFGGLVGAFLVEAIGRRGTFMLGFFGGGVPLVYLAIGGAALAPFSVFLASATSMMFLAFLLLGLYAYAPENYPTRLRATGAGGTSAWLRVGSIVGPLLVGLLLTIGTINQVFLLFAASALIGGLVVFFLADETRGRRLDDPAG